jgi:hypothetical protein
MQYIIHNCKLTEIHSNCDTKFMFVLADLIKIVQTIFWSG